MEIILLSCIGLLIVGTWGIVFITGQEEATMRGFITLFMGETFSLLLLTLGIAFIYLGIKAHG